MDSIALEELLKELNSCNENFNINTDSDVPDDSLQTTDIMWEDQEMA
jgi:hypothetical protein